MVLNSKCKITALGTYIPKKKLTNHDLEKMVETSDEWIVKRTGIKERFICADDEFASDIAIKAVQNLLDTNSVTLENVDMVIVSAFVPDHLTPSISAIVAGHFHLNSAGSYDLHAACSGFSYSFITANAFLTSGIAKKILLITAETMSKVIDYTDRNTCILFGDGAVAMLIEYKENETLFVSNFGTDGDLADKLYCSEFSPSVNGTSVVKEHLFWQNGRAIYEYVVKNITENVLKLLSEANLSPEDIDWFVPHSANLRIIDALCERLGIDSEKTLTSVERFGNTSSSSIPLAISLGLNDGRLKPGDKVLIYGFGGGLTHSGAIFEW